MYHIQVVIQKQAIGSKPPHICNTPYCNPQNELDLIGLGALNGPPLTQNVWVCNKGVTHVCTPELCQLGILANMGEIVCQLSGMVLGMEQRPEQSSNPDWTPHWKPMPSATRKRVARAPSASKKLKSAQTPENRAENVRKNLPKRFDVLKRARRIVDTLLYGVVRSRANDAHKLQCKDRAERNVQTYRVRQQSNNKFSHMHHILELVSNAWRQPPPFVELLRDEKVIQLYAHIIIQVWDRILQFMLSPCESGGQRVMLFNRGIRPNVDSVILGTLYIMREGYMPYNKCMLPMDPFLAHYLPSQKDLPLFKFAKRSIASGQSLLRDMYNRALEHHVPEHVLCLDYSLLRQYMPIANSMDQPGPSEMEFTFTQAACLRHGSEIVPRILKSTSRYHICNQCQQRFKTEGECRDHYCW